MELTLDRSDLKPEFVNINCSQTRFEHFSESAQQAIRKAGKAMFWDYYPGGMTSYNAIFAPKG